jgi:uridine kinase
MDEFPKSCIGITGGTGSGKTTVARIIENEVKDDAVIIPQDAYYRDWSHLGMEERHSLNLDHPDAFDMEMFTGAIRALKRGKVIEMPGYNYATHGRLEETRSLKPARILIIEGILALYTRELRDLFDVKIFVDAASDLRFIRRITRDVRQRGRSFDSVIDQYLGSVRDMHLEFIEPTKRYADFLLPEGGHNKPAMRVVLACLRDFLAGNTQSVDSDPGT